MSNLNVIVFCLCSIEQSTSVPSCTLITTNFGTRSFGLFERLDLLIGFVADVGTGLLDFGGCDIPGAVVGIVLGAGAT